MTKQEFTKEIEARVLWALDDAVKISFHKIHAGWLDGDLKHILPSLRKQADVLWLRHQEEQSV